MDFSRQQCGTTATHGRIDQSDAGAGTPATTPKWNYNNDEQPVQK